MTSENKIPAPSAASELATVTVSSRIPEFWCDQARLWFVQFEAILTPQKLSDEARFNLVVTKLGKEVIQQVSDILLQQPQSKKYETLKERLLAVYEESEDRQLRKLLSEIDLGDQKPSQLLRRMRDLARGKIPDETLNIMWQGHLPSPVRAVLAVTEVKDLENLSTIADKILEATRSPQVAEVTSEPSTSQDFSTLQAQIAQLTLQVMALQTAPRSRERSRSRSNYNRYRSKSRGRNMIQRGSNDADGLCYYHARFRHRAYKCTEPCTWKQQNTQNQEN